MYTILYRQIHVCRSLSRYIYGIRISRDIHVYAPSSPGLGAELPRAILNPNDSQRCQNGTDAGGWTVRDTGH